MQDTLKTEKERKIHPRGIIVCDEQAAIEPRVGTVKNFRDIELVRLDPATLLFESRIASYDSGDEPKTTSQRPDWQTRLRRVTVDRSLTMVLYQAGRRYSPCL